jgi:glutamate-ammonia-ligase adenylyltransferase
MKMELPHLVQSKSWFIEKHLSDLNHPLIDSAKKLLLISDYACRQVQLLKTLLSHDECLFLWSREDYMDALKGISFDLPQATYASALRQFRNTHFLRLLLLELSKIANTSEIMHAWSDCADGLILHALDYWHHSLSSRYGVPRDEMGTKVHLYTLAMGKLGGRELNYSSDVDLIFAYTAQGETDGEEGISNQQFFSKLVQQFVQTLQNVTADGFVFRVDLRLRPNGESGPLVSSLAAMETYYQEQGRDWERYAMIKARVITPSIDEVPVWFNSLIIPFVYRRYVDFSVIESLRSMKAMIEREVELNPRLDDIKRGQGGIREVEFIIQNVQLIRGGRLPQLQTQNTLTALSIVKQEHLLPHTEALKQAYLFLRHLENVLQSLNDQQTHSLPEDPLKQDQVTLAMEFSSWNDLIDKLHQYQRIIRYEFRSVLGKVEDYEDQKRLLTHQFTSLWQGHVEPSMAINLLASLGFNNASYCYQMIHSFRHSPRCRRLTQAARMRLDRFMVMLLAELAKVDKTDEVLLQVMHLLEHIVGRSAYLALLTENPQVLTELLFWFANSPFITSLLVNQPFLLEVLLDQNEQWKPLSLNQLKRSLVEQLVHRPDVEMQEELLRQFKLMHWLMAARAELYGFCNAVRIGQFLSDVAQVIVNQVLEIASQQLSVRYPEMNKIKKQFAIIAYGKLGSREMNYASDLDLVFLHAVPPAEEALITRLTQKIVHTLTTRSQSGVLYRVDTRLRPSGSAGLLVSHLDAFVDYQKNQAWTWEHQALLKARLLAGTTLMNHALMQLKEQVLLNAKNKATLQQDVLAMRAKMEQHQERNSIANDLLDLEFLLQFLILRLGDPSFAGLIHPLNQMHHLFLAGVFSKKQYVLLKKAYKKLHQALHQNLLRPGEVMDKNISEELRIVYEEFL